MDESNFLKNYLKLHENTEVPPLFALWCGLSGLSSVLGRRCWIDMGTYMVYPNLYIVLIAGSGQCRKSTAIGMIEKIVRQVEPGPKIIAQKITPEALIETLQDSGDKTLVSATHEGYVIADELVVFLNRKSYESGLGGLLISFYDCKDNFEYRTRGRGSEKLHNTSLGLLAGSTIDLVRDAIPLEAVGSGLTSRMVFVFVEHPTDPVAITRFSEEKKLLMEKCARHLSTLQRLKGHITVTPEGWELFEEIYNKLHKENPFDEPGLTGYSSRRHVHLLKVALGFAVAATDPTLTIEKHHLEGAHELLTASEVFMPRVLRLITSTERGSLQEIVLSKIVSSGGISKARLLRTMSHRLSSRDLAEIIDTLIHSRQIKAYHRDKDIVYVLVS